MNVFETLDPEMTNKQIDLFHGQANVARYGAGSPLMILHGAGGPEMWSQTVSSLSSCFDVMLPTHPGYGDDGLPDWLERVEDMVFHYQSLLDAMDLEKVHLVGHSLGGWIAAEIAARNPDRILSLQLVSPAGLLLPEEPMADNFLWTPEETIDHLVCRKEVSDRLKGIQTDDEAAILRYSRMVTTAKLVWAPRWHNPALHKWLHRITAPTNIVWGRNDSFIPFSYASEFSRLVQGSTISPIKNCGHAPMLDAPDEFTSKISSFAKENAK